MLEQESRNGHEEGGVLLLEARPLEDAVERLSENVPEELRRRRQWVAWKLERRGNKETKVPYIATGSVDRASTTDPGTWRTFEEAVRVLWAGRYDGVGFVFSSGDPYAGIDLDDCRDPVSGVLEEWAEEIVRTFGSSGAYVEASPSGGGVHIITRGKAPNKKRGNVEAYSEGRFFTMTGRTL